jgi:hypothetical protein
MFKEGTITLVKIIRNIDMVYGKPIEIKLTR